MHATSQPASAHMNPAVAPSQAAMLMRLCAGLQLVARHSKKHKERHLHGGIPLGVAAVGMAMLPAFLEKEPWVAFGGMVRALVHACHLIMSAVVHLIMPMLSAKEQQSKCVHCRSIVNGSLLFQLP